MKITIDIPKEFEKHFNDDRFKDSLERIECDIQDDINEEHTIPVVSALWELELINMLIGAFKNAEFVKYGNWICHRKDYYDTNGDIYMSCPMPTECSVCGFAEMRARRFTFCPNCGARMED